jgi:hypothetical protein
VYAKLLTLKLSNLPGSMVKYTNTYLTKLEDLFKESSYKIRYERGNFKSGSCIIEESKIIVINKFASLDTKINFLIEALKNHTIDEELLSEKSRSFYQELKQTTLSF